jgi:hypothetical protein
MVPGKLRFGFPAAAIRWGDELGKVTPVKWALAVSSCREAQIFPGIAEAPINIGDIALSRPLP